MIMKEEVIVKNLDIKKIGEKQFFQISLPHDAKRIIGIEHGVTSKDGVLLPSPTFAPLSVFGGEDDDSLEVFENKIVGRLVLRGSSCSGIFYQDDVVENQNAHIGENIAAVIWSPQFWTHGRKRHETPLCVSENRMIHGFFEDSWGIGQYQTLSYTLNLYVWIEKCIK
jgi:hypothetical protein